MPPELTVFAASPTRLAEAESPQYLPQTRPLAVDGVGDVAEEEGVVPLDEARGRLLVSTWRRDIS